MSRIFFYIEMDSHDLYRLLLDFITQVTYQHNEMLHEVTVSVLHFNDHQLPAELDNKSNVFQLKNQSQTDVVNNKNNMKQVSQERINDELINILKLTIWLSMLTNKLFSFINLNLSTQFERTSGIVKVIHFAS